MARILQVSDSHLSPRSPYADSNWDAVVEHARRTAPDLVVHSGDITLNGSEDIADLRHGRAQLDKLPVPWRAIPGNHDVGDCAGTPPTIDARRRDRYGSVFGERCWATTLEGWRIVGADVQMLASDLPDADEEWEWLGDELRVDGPVALFLHRPLAPHDPADGGAWHLPAEARARLGSLLGESDVHLVGSGHVHQWRSATIEGRQHVWAPSTWAVLPDEVQPVIGQKVTGVVEHVLHVGPAGPTVTSTLVQPLGVLQVVSGVDFPSPYDDH